MNAEKHLWSTTLKSNICQHCVCSGSELLLGMWPDCLLISHPPYSSLLPLQPSFSPFPQSLGQLGRVIKVFPTGDVRVSVNGRTWTYNPLCLVPAPGENPPDSAREFIVDMHEHDIP